VAERLRQLDTVKNTFITVVSHELRTPLTVVCGMAATLRRLGSSVSGDTRALLEGAIEHHADRLRVLLDNAAKYAQNGTTEVRLRRADEGGGVRPAPRRSRVGRAVDLGGASGRRGSRARRLGRRGAGCPGPRRLTRPHGAPGTTKTPPMIGGVFAYRRRCALVP
jgi:hypothetical protein